MSVELMPHQVEAVNNLDNGKILYGGVGVGKTITALAYYMKKEAPRDIYVITTAKKRDSRDWETEAIKFGISEAVGLSLAGVLTVDSWNNIQKYVDVHDAFFIFDEQRLVGTGAWVRAFQRIAQRNRWILLTATPGDTWIDYVPVFIANGLYKNPTQFKREHVVYAPFTRYPKIVKYLEVGTLLKYRNMLLVEMPYVRHTTRVIKEIICDYDKSLWNAAVKQRWNPFEQKPLKDVSELFRVMRKVVNTDASRLRELDKMRDAHPRIVVFYNFDYELKILRDYCLKSGVCWTEWNGHRHEEVPESQSWLYLVQYVAGAEAWECTYTDTICFYSLTYSYKNFMQAQGRIDRLNTPFKVLTYYVLMSDSIIDKAIWNTLKRKESFNENDWGRTEMASTLDLWRNEE